MNDSQITELDMGQRVRAYTATLPADFPAGSRAAIVLAMLDTAIKGTEQAAAEQISANLDRQESTEQKQAAINPLVEMMQAVNQIARSIDPQFPGIADQFKMGRGGDQGTLNLARSFIANATPMAAEFTSRGMPATFIADMQAGVDAADSAENRQSIARTAQSAATAAVALALKQLRAAVRELDAIFKAKYRQDPATLAAWQTASHVEKAPKKKKGATKKPSPPPPTSS